MSIYIVDNIDIDVINDIDDIDVINHIDDIDVIDDIDDNDDIVDDDDMNNNHDIDDNCNIDSNHNMTVCPRRNSISFCFLIICINLDLNNNGKAFQTAFVGDKLK